MIPFFRRIRKKMADDNRPLKYARYAIGEIVLVVIGILIALQINTWNEERKNKDLEFLTLSELKKNIDSDLKQMDTINTRIEQAITSAEIVLQSLASDQKYHDSLNYHFGWAMIYIDMNFHKGIYESIKYSGSQIINDETLRFEINNYYDYSVIDMEEGFREIRDDFYNYMLAYLREDFKYYHSISTEAEPRDFDALKQNETYQLSLGIFLDVQRLNLRKLKQTITKSSELMELVDGRIEEIKR